MDRKFRMTMYALLLTVFVVWVFLTNSVQQVAWKATNEYKQALSEHNYEVITAETQRLKEKDIKAYRKVYYERGNFYYKNTRYEEAIIDYDVALHNCGWDTYKGVDEVAPGFISRGNCHFKTYDIPGTIKDYATFFKLYIARTCAFILAFCLSHLIIFAPLLLIVLLVIQHRKKHPKKKKETTTEEPAFKKLYNDNTPHM